MALQAAALPRADRGRRPDRDPRPARRSRPDSAGARAADPEIEVVLHAGRQDVALLKRSWDTEIHNIFDTQVAAGFAGYGAQSGYDSLVRSLLGVSAKGAEGFEPLGPPAADRRPDRVRASGRRTPAADGRRASGAPAPERPARVGARRVLGARTSERRAAAGRPVRAAAAGPPARQAPARSCNDDRRVAPGAG